MPSSHLYCVGLQPTVFGEYKTAGAWRGGTGLYVLCVLCVGGFIFRNWGPLQKVCRDADTHARPRLPPGAAPGRSWDGAFRFEV
jgi:hypothetical protein